VAEPRKAFLDANVLLGQLTTDTMLSLAHARLFEPQWSEKVLDEVRRNRPDGVPESSIDSRFAQMNKIFPAAMTSGYEPLMPQMQADDKDKHVLAAAVQSGSDVLVTENVKDFKPPARGPHAMPVERTSAFLSRLLEENPDRVIEAMNKMVARNRREPTTMPELIDKMATQQDLKGFAHKLNEAVPPEQRGSHPNLIVGKAMQTSASIALDGVAPAKGAAAKPVTTPEASQSKQNKDQAPNREL
jgi:predicted nucleic acid-binding protein